MSEQKPKVAPANNDPKVDPEVIQTKTRKIKIHVDRDPEITALQKELAELQTKTAAEKKTQDDAYEALKTEKETIAGKLTEKESVLAKQSLEKFESKKAAILKLCTDSKLDETQIAEIEEKLSTPENLAVVEGLVNMLVSSIKKPDPVKPEIDPKTGKPIIVGKDGKPITKKPVVAGKATFIPPDNAATYEDERAMIDLLYEQKENKKGKYTVQEQKTAIAKIDQLFKTLIGSKSWQQMRDGLTIGKTQVMACPKCHTTLRGKLPDRCPTCNFNFTKTGDMRAGRG